MTTSTPDKIPIERSTTWVSIGHTNANANMWLTGSVLYLCPNLNYLTHYPTNR